jgi:hypothetical protein
MSTRLGWIATLALASSIGCTRNRPGTQLGSSGGEPPASVTVQNDNWLDVAVYVVRGTSRFRIGTVTSTSRQTFRLPLEGSIGALPLQILADPIGANRQYLTDPVTLSPGQRLEVRIGSPINLSSFAIWNN